MCGAAFNESAPGKRWSGKPQGRRGAFNDFAEALVKSICLAESIQGVSVLRKGVGDFIPVGAGEVGGGHGLPVYGVLGSRRRSQAWSSQTGTYSVSGKGVVLR